MKIYDSVLETIGNTPLVNLSRLTKGLEGTILAKIEFFNPGFSKKDRIGLQMIEEAEKNGELKPGMTIVELTSGNTGTGLSIVSAIKGYHFIAVMSKGNSIERAKMMKAFGAEVIRVNQAPNSLRGQVSGEDLALVEETTQKLVKQLGAFRADQFHLEANWKAHYYHTGQELINQTQGKIDAFCDFVGSSGSYVGITKSLKEFNSEIKCFVIEPQSASVLAGKPITNNNHKIQGGGYSMTNLEFLENVEVDGYVQITDGEAIQYCKKLAKKEGIFGGFSSGANVAAAVKLLESELNGKTIVSLICDSGLKYLSTDLWE